MLRLRLFIYFQGLFKLIWTLKVLQTLFCAILSYCTEVIRVLSASGPIKIFLNETKYGFNPCTPENEFWN